MTFLETKLLEVCKKFRIAGEYRSFEEVHSGHINTTYRVYFSVNGEMEDYIVQKVNTYVFEKPIEMMENIASVTDHIRSKITARGIDAKRFVLQYFKTA